MPKRVNPPPKVSEHGFAVRVPIFDLEKRVAAYALTFLRRLSNSTLEELERLPLPATHEAPSDRATAVLQAMAHGRTLVLPVGKNLDDQELLSRLPVSGNMFTLREGQRLGEVVVARCRALRKLGGEIYAPTIAGLLQEDEELADVDWVGIDFRRYSQIERIALSESYRSLGCRMVARNVDTLEEFREACDLGFERAQGDFYLRSVDEPGKIPESTQTTFDLLRALQSPQVDFDQVELVIKQDLSLPVRLLQYLNSAAFGFRCKIESVRHGLVLLGEREVRAWAATLALSSLAPTQCRELFVSAVLRARFCEGIATALGDEKQRFSFFLTGLLSQLDVILSQPLRRVIAHLPLPSDVRQALDGRRCLPLKALNAVRSYELGDWEGLRLKCRSLGLAPGCLPPIYWESLRFASALDNDSEIVGASS